MNAYFWFVNLIIIIAVPIGFFTVAYFLVKMAVKKGIIEAYKEIHKKQ